MKIFLSYSHKDTEICVRLEGILRLQEHEGGHLWRDDQISPGLEWDAEIARQLQEAEIIAFLVSPTFLQSGYIPEKELQPALARHRNGTARIVPILLESCDWKGSALSQLEALPSGAKPISEWKNETDAMLNVAAGMRKVAFDLAAQRSVLHAGGAILTLAELAKDPRVLAAILVYKEQFRASAEQILPLFDCKSVHDILHAVRFETFLPLKSLAPRFPQEPPACSDALRYAVILQGKVEDLSQIASRWKDTDVELVLRHLRQSSEFLRSAVDNDDRASLDKALAPLGPLLAQLLPRFAARLDGAAEALGLGALVKGITAISSQVRNIEMDPADQTRIEAGVKALTDLLARLTALKDEHKRWQAIDIEFVLAESATLSFTEFSAFWPGLNDNLAELCRGRTEDWASALLRDVSRLNDAKNDMGKVQRLFPALLQRGGDRFFKVDRELKGVAEDLSKLDDPLRQVIGALGS